jgi:hypothetical protein
VITKKEHVLLIDAAIFGDRNEIKEAPEMFLKYKDLATETQDMWNVKNKSDTNWKHLNIIQKMSEQHNRKN